MTKTPVYDWADDARRSYDLAIATLRAELLAKREAMPNEITILALPGRALPNGLELPPGLSFGEWVEVGQRLQRFGRSYQWMIGDWLNYGEKNYGETYAQAIDETGLGSAVLMNLKWVAARFEISRRREISWGHHCAAAPLAPEIADELLDRAEDLGWSEKELRTHVSIRRRSDKHKAIAGGARDIDLGSSRFALLYADPPWTFETYSELGKELTSPEQHYPTMPIGEISGLEIQGRPIYEVAQKDAGLFLWCTSSNVHLALAVIEAWGFEYKTNLAWDKIKSGTGYIFLNQHELLLYGSRGAFPAPAKIYPSVYREKKTKHSAKPTGIRKMLESMYPEFTFANRLELFARGKVEGWTTWGNQA